MSEIKLKAHVHTHTLKQWDKIRSHSHKVSSKFSKIIPSVSRVIKLVQTEEK